MTYLCSTGSLPYLLALLLHDLHSLCSFLTSHHLLLAYLLLLFPYLLKLALFLHPLLFSTFLLAVTFHVHDSSSTSVECPSTTCSAVLNFLRDEFISDEAKNIQHLCSILFADFQLGCYQMDLTEDFVSGNQINDFQLVSISQGNNLLEDAKAEVGKAEDLKEEESNAETIPQNQKEQRRRPEILQRESSVRKEKEWKRTLACKIFEERMTYKLCEKKRVVEGAEEMDLLWEAYEADAHKTDKHGREEKDTKKAVKKKVEKKGVENEEDQEEGLSGQLCCLQALKFSAGKMNLGVGGSNLVKISMVMKGMTLLQRSVRRIKFIK